MIVHFSRNPNPRLALTVARIWISALPSPSTPTTPRAFAR